MDRALAARMAELSAGAYDAAAPFTVTVENGYTAIAFPGTHVDPWSWDDVRVDLEAELVAWPAGGRVHAGFASRARRMAADVAQAVTREMPTYFVGHSLGAGEAVLCASILPAAAVCTFGCPRVGDAAFWRGMRAPLFRFVNALDVVPRLPPPIDDYRHGGERWHIGRGGTLRRSAWRPWPDWAPVPLERGVLDHRIGEYARLLKGN